MSELLDERVVEMRFDNANFEQNVNQSIKTINKLKDSLDFDNAGESFENISAAAQKCDITPLEKSLENVTVKFDMLEMVAANVLSRIVNQAIDAGTRLAKSLSIDQISAGWSKYEQKTQSVQTIMSATGASIDYVNNKLEKLIWFADETSYDFVDMVNNIGKFTSAGIDLDDAVNSMMGISNWAALSGAGIQQASRAMYNLSQAIGMGYVGIQDWKSIELANMATLEFKQTVIDTAVELGTLRQQADGTITTLDGKEIVTAETMRNSLKKQWFTSDVLTTALTEYSDVANQVKEYIDEYEELHGVVLNVNKALAQMEEQGLVEVDSLGYKAFKKAQEAITFTQALNATADAASSGWMRTFEIIFGNYEKATKLWTDLANDMWDIFAGPGETRNESLKDIFDSNYQKMLDEMPDGDEFSSRLYQKLYDITKNNLGEETTQLIFSQYKSLEDYLQNAYLYDSTLDNAFTQISEDYKKEADRYAKLSEDLKSGQITLKQAAVKLASNQYGSDEETIRKNLESIGFDYEYLIEYAEAWKQGIEINWDAEQQALIKGLDATEKEYRSFIDTIAKDKSIEGFFAGLKELGGRDKLMGGFQNVFRTFKNIYLLIIEISNGVRSLFGGDSFINGLIDGFYRFTSAIRITNDDFDRMQESITAFFHGGIQKKWNEFLHGKNGKVIRRDFDEVTHSYIEFYEHIPGLLDYVSDIYENHLMQLPEDVAKTVESIRKKVIGFFGELPQTISDLKEKIFGHIEEFRVIDSNSITTEYEYVGGILNDLKTKISEITSGLGGKAFNGLINIFKKIADFLFGYEKDGEQIEGAFIKIYDKATALWEKLKDIGKIIKEFFFGRDENTSRFLDIDTGKFEYGVTHIKGLFDNIKDGIDSIAKSTAFTAIKNFIFGDKESKTPNIFGRMQSVIDSIAKSSAYQSVHDFIFGGKKSTLAIDDNGEYVEKLEDIPNIFERIKQIITDIKESDAFIAVKNFIFGGEDADGQPVYSFFERIKGYFGEIQESSAYQAVHDFIFGKEAPKSGIKNSIFGQFMTKDQLEQLNLIDRIRAILFDIKSFWFTGYDVETYDFKTMEAGIKHVNGKFQDLVQSPAFIAVKEFFLGRKNEEGKTEVPNILEKIKKIFESIPESVKTAKDAIIDFFLGPVNEEGKRVDNIFKRLPTYFKNGKKVIKEFFVGNTETGKQGLVERIREQINKLKEEHPWVATFCSFIENQVQNIKKLLDDANGSVVTALSNLNSYLFGGNITKQSKNEFGEIVTELTPVNGIITEIRENISKLFNGGKEKKDQNFLSGIIDKLGIGKTSIIKTVSKILLTLMGLNILFTKIDLGKFGEWGFKSVFEQMVENLSEFAEAVFKLSLSFVILNVASKLLKNDYKTILISLGLLFAISKILLDTANNFNDSIGKDQKINFAPMLLLRVLADTITQLVILVGAFALFLKVSNIGNGDLLKAVGVVAGLMLLLGVIGKMMVVVSDKGQQVKTAAPALLAFSILLYSISNLVTTLAIVFGALHLFTKGKDFSEFANAIELLKLGLIAIAAMIGVISISVALISLSSKNFKPATIGLVAVLMSGLVAIVISISKLYSVVKNAEWQQLAALFGGIAILLLAVSGCVAMISGIRKIDKSAIAMILLFPVLIAALGGVAFALSYLANIAPLSNIKNLILFFGTMGVVILMMIPLIGIFAIVNRMRNRINDDTLFAFGELIVALLEIGLLVSSIFFVLSKIPTPNVTALATFFASMLATVLLIIPVIGIFKLVNAAKKDITGNNFTVFFNIYMSMYMIAIFASLVYSLANILPSGTWTTIGSFIAVMLATVASMALIPLIFRDITKYKLDAVKDYSGILKAFSLMSVALFQLAVLAGLILLELKGLDKVFELFKLEGSVSIQNALVFAGIMYVLANIMRTLTRIFERLSYLDPNTNYTNVITAFSIMSNTLLQLGLVVTGMLLAIKLLSKIDGTSSGMDILVFAGVMYILAQIMQIIAGLIPKLAEFNATVGKNKDTYKKVAKSFGSIAGILIAMGAIVALFMFTIPKIPIGGLGGLLQFFAAIGLMALMFVGVSRVLTILINVSKTITDSSVKTIGDLFTRISGFILILGVFVYFLSSLSIWANLDSYYPYIAAMIALGASLLVFGRFVNELTRMSTQMISANGVRGVLKFLGATVLLMTALSGIVYALTFVANRTSGLDRVLPFIAAIAATGVLVLALSGIVALVSRISEWGHVFKNAKNILKTFGVVSVVLVALSGIVAALAWVASKITGLDAIGPLLLTIIEVSGAILALSLIVTAIGYVAKIGKGAALDAAVFMAEIIAIIAVIGVIVGAIGWLFGKLEEVEGIGEGGIVDSINKFGDMFEALTNAIGRGLGGLIGGIGEGLTDSLETIGGNLSMFMISMKPFFSVLETLNDAHKTGIDVLTSVMAGILEATFYEKITEVLDHLGTGGDLITVVNNLSTLTTESIKPFLETIAGIKDSAKEDFARFNDIMVDILAASFLNSIGEIISYFGGEGQLPKVIENLNKMVSENLRPFLNSISGITDDDATALDTFNDLMLKIVIADFLSKVADIISKVGGEGTLPLVIQNLKNMVKNNLRPFLDEIAKIKQEDFDAISSFNELMLSIVIAEFLGKMADLIAHIGGEGDLPGIIQNMKKMYTEDLRPFIDELKNIKPEDSEAISSFNDLMLKLVGATFLDKIANVINQIGPENNTTKIISSLSSAYDEIKDFIAKVSGITDDDKAALSNFNSVMYKIVGATFYAKITDVLGHLGGEGDLTKVITKMKDMVGDLEPFLEEIRKIDPNDPTNAANFASIMNSIMQAEFFNKISEVIQKLGDGESNDLTPIITKLKDSVTDLEGFLGAISVIKDDDPKHAANFVSIMGSIMAAEFFGKIAGVISNLGNTENLSNLFTDLTTLTTGMMDFLNSTTELKDTHVAGATKFSEILGKILGATLETTAIAALDSLISVFAGDTNFSTYMTNMKILADGAKDISDKVQGVDSAKVVSATEAIKALLLVATDSRFKSGGLVSNIGEFLRGSTNFTKLFEILNGTGNDDGVIDYLKIFSQKVGNDDFSNAKQASNAISAVFSVLSFDPSKLKKFGEIKSDKDGLDGLQKSILYLTNTLIPKIQDLQEVVDKKDISKLGTALSIIRTLLNLLYSENLFFIYTSGDGSNLLSDPEAQTHVLDSIAFIKDKLIQSLNELNAEIGDTDFTNIKEFANTLSSIFNLFTYKNDITNFSKLSENDINNAFNRLKNNVITQISLLNEELTNLEIDDSVVDNVIGSYADLINGIVSLQQNEDGEEVSQVGQYVIEGLVNALINGDNRNAVYNAAVELGKDLIAGLKAGTQEQSPSKAAYVVGEFIAQGLVNGLSAGEGMTWSMARMFGEGTIKALEQGMSQHAINMVTEDLVDENIFNMPDFSYIDRFGMENIDFDKMRDFLHEKFGEVFDESIIDNFVLAYKNEMGSLQKEIKNEDYAKLMQGINNGDYGTGKMSIVDALTEELGSVEAAEQAWQDYNDVLEGNIKINKDLLKEKKKNPPMTEKEWQDMWAHIQEGYDLVNTGKLDRSELEAKGYDLELTQAMLNQTYGQGKNIDENYIRLLAEEEIAREREKNAAQEQANAVNAANDAKKDSVDASEKNIKTNEAVAESAEEVTESYWGMHQAGKKLWKESNMQLVKSGFKKYQQNVELTEKELEAIQMLQYGVNSYGELGDVYHQKDVYKSWGLDPDEFYAYLQLDDINAKIQENLKAEQEAAEKAKTSVDKVADSADVIAETDATGSYNKELNETIELQNEVAETSTEAAAAMDEVSKVEPIDYNVWNKALDKVRKGQKDFTEAEKDILYKQAWQEIDSGTFGVGVGKDKMIANMESKGLTGANAKLAYKLGRQYAGDADAIEKYVLSGKEAAEVNTNVGTSTDKTTESVEKQSEALNNASEETKSFLGVFSDAASKALDAGKDLVSIDLSEFTKALGEDFDLSSALSNMGLDADSVIEAGSLEFKFKDIGLIDIKDKEQAKKILSVEGLLDMIGFDSQSMDITGAVGDITWSDATKFIGDVLFDPKHAKKNAFLTAVDFAGRKLGLIKDTVEEVNDTTLDPQVNTSNLTYADGIIEEIKKKYELLKDSTGEPIIAKQGYQNLVNGVTLSMEQAEELTKLWDGIMQGFYGKDYKEIAETLQSNLDIDWDTFRSYGRNFDQYASPVGKYVDQVKSLGAAYTTTKWIEDSYAGKLGETSVERKKAYEALGLDSEKAEALFQAYLKRGTAALDELGDAKDNYARLTDEEKEAAEQKEKLDMVLNSTPEGAFRSIADFLDGVNKAISNGETAQHFTEFIDAVTGSMQGLSFENASQFEIVGNFLNAIRTTARESTAIVKDFSDFTRNIQDSLNKLSDVKIENPEAMTQVTEFLNGIVINNKDSLDSVTSFLDDILSFAGSDEELSYAGKIGESVDTLMTKINGIELIPEATQPLLDFLAKLTDASTILSASDSGSIQVFINNLYSAIENSGPQATFAAETIINVINETFLGKDQLFMNLGRYIVIWLAAGIMGNRDVAVEAANSISTSLLTAFDQQAVDKAAEHGKTFVSEFSKGINSEESQQIIQTALDALFTAGEEAGEATGQGMAEGSGEAVSVGSKFGQQFVHDMAQSITEGSVTVFTGLTQSIANLPQSISEALDEDKQKELTAAVDGISSMLSGIVPDGSSMAMNMIEGIISTLTANGPLIADLMAWIAAGAQGEFNRENESHSPSRKYKKFAGYITDGIVIGLQNGSRDVNKASADVALGALNTAKDVLGIHSPGKEPEEQIGIPYDQGVAKGIENGEPAVQAAVTDMAENAVETGNSVISKNLGKSIDTGLFRNNLMNNLNNLSPYPAGTNKYLQDVQNDIKNIMGEIITTEENGLTVGQTLTERAIEHFMSATSGIKTMTEEEAAVIQGFWSQILNGDFGVLEGANSATGREAMLKELNLTWEQFARFSNNTSTLDLSSITKGINDYSDAVSILTKDSSTEDVINSIYSGLLGNGEKRKEAIEGLGKDYDFTQFILKKMWNLKPGEKIDYDFIDANYEALLNSFNDAVAAGKDLLGEEMDEAVPIVISPTVDDTALNAARDKIIEATTSQQEAQKVATTEQSNAPKVGDNTESTGGAAPSVVYNQYNTSPKALKPSEIYRQTKNQLARLNPGTRRELTV